MRLLFQLAFVLLSLLGLSEGSIQTSRTLRRFIGIQNTRNGVPASTLFSRCVNRKSSIGINNEPQRLQNLEPNPLDNSIVNAHLEMKENQKVLVSEGRLLDQLITEDIPKVLKDGLYMSLGQNSYDIANEEYDYNQNPSNNSTTIDLDLVIADLKELSERRSQLIFQLRDISAQTASIMKAFGTATRMSNKLMYKELIKNLLPEMDEVMDIMLMMLNSSDSRTKLLVGMFMDAYFEESKKEEEPVYQLLD